jgi:hypothetical protein
VLANFVLLGLTFHSERFWAVLRPFLYLAAAAETRDLLVRLARARSLRRLPAAGLAALCTLAVVRFALTASDHLRLGTATAGERRSFAILADRTPARAVIVSDLSAQVALYAGRRAVRLPPQPDQLLELCALRGIDHVLFGPRLGEAGYDARGLPASARPYRRYAGFRESARFQAFFAPAARLPGGATLYRRRAAGGAAGVQSAP